MNILQLALLVYVWVPDTFKSADAAENIKQECSDLCLLRTTQAVTAMRQYQADPTPGDSLWHASEFARQAAEYSRWTLNTTFHTHAEGKFHVSITPINFYCQQTRLVPRPPAATL